MKDISLPICVKNKYETTFTFYTISGQFCKVVIIDERNGICAYETVHYVKYTEKDTEPDRKQKLLIYMKRILNECQILETITYEEFLIKVDYVLKVNNMWCKETINQGEGSQVLFEVKDSESDPGSLMKYTKGYRYNTLVINKENPF